MVLRLDSLRMSPTRDTFSKLTTIPKGSFIAYRGLLKR